MRHVVQSAQDGLGKLILLQDILVGRGDDHASLGIERPQVVRGPGHGRRRVAVGRLFQDVLRRQPGQLLADNVAIAGVGHDKNMFTGDYLGKPVIGGLQQRAPRAQEIKELLGQSLVATGPESAADASGHNYDMIIHAHITPLFLEYF